MYLPNLERNKIIYELWEKGLTVERIASMTDIPRSTVGYYVRKFNRLAIEKKPIVFPKERKVSRVRRTSSFSKFHEPAKEMVVMQARANILKMLSEHQYQELYYFLMDLKLINELDSIVTSETFEKAINSILPQ